jgi:hypothetical protein
MSTSAVRKTWARSALGTLLIAFVVVVHFEQHAALFALERTMMHAGRPARIGRRDELFAAYTLHVSPESI